MTDCNGAFCWLADADFWVSLFLTLIMAIGVMGISFGFIKIMIGHVRGGVEFTGWMVWQALLAMMTLGAMLEAASRWMP